MPLYNVYVRERFESCLEVQADDEEEAKQKVVDGGGTTKWRDFLDYIELDRVEVVRVGGGENEENDEEPDEMPPVPDDPPRVAQPRIGARLQQAAIDLAAQQRGLRRARAEAPPEPEPVEDVDFEG